VKLVTPDLVPVDVASARDEPTASIQVSSLIGFAPAGSSNWFCVAESAAHDSQCGQGQRALAVSPSLLPVS
jgi:hypothetical protein